MASGSIRHGRQRPPRLDGVRDRRHRTLAIVENDRVDARL
jgi:hypothetical protein